MAGSPHWLIARLVIDPSLVWESGRKKNCLELLLSTMKKWKPDKNSFSTFCFAKMTHLNVEFRERKTKKKSQTNQSLMIINHQTRYFFKEEYSELEEYSFSVCLSLFGYFFCIIHTRCLDVWNILCPSRKWFFGPMLFSFF